MYFSKTSYGMAVVLLLIVTALAAAGAIIWSGFDAEAKARAQARLSAAIINDLRRVEASLLDAETGQRGFLLSRDPEYLAPYYNGVAEFPAVFADLQSLLRGLETDTQKTALANLERVAKAKLAELNDSIVLSRDGQHDAAIAMVQTDVGRDLMLDIRQEVAALLTEEQAILQATLTMADTRQSQIGRNLVGALALILMLLGVMLVLFWRSVKLNRTEELLEEVSLHRDRAALLAQELSHRVKNLFGIVTSIVRMTGRGETDAAVAVEKITQRVGALSRAHALTGLDDVADRVDLKDLVQAILAPYDDKDRFITLRGPDVMLGRETLTPLGMILHELATNAVKYGAWAQDANGQLDIAWQWDGTVVPEAGTRQVALSWAETLDPDAQSHAAARDDAIASGFGTRMIEMSTRQINGRLTKAWANGFRAELTFALPAQSG